MQRVSLRRASCTSSWDGVRLFYRNKLEAEESRLPERPCSAEIDLTFWQTYPAGKMGPSCPLGSTRCNSQEHEYVWPCSHAGWLIATPFFGVLLREHGEHACHWRDSLTLYVAQGCVKQNYQLLENNDTCCWNTKQTVIESYLGLFLSNLHAHLWTIGIQLKQLRHG